MRKYREYESIEHTADVGIRAFGPTLKDLFQNAGKAFFNIITELEMVDLFEEKNIVIENKGKERLLVSWLSEFLYLFEVDGWLFRRCEILSLDENRVEAICLGEKFDPKRHPIKTEIKGVTHHQLLIQKVHGLWEATIILDI